MLESSSVAEPDPAEISSARFRPAIRSLDPALPESLTVICFRRLPGRFQWCDSCWLVDDRGSRHDRVSPPPVSTRASRFASTRKSGTIWRSRRRRLTVEHLALALRRIIMENATRRRARKVWRPAGYDIRRGSPATPSTTRHLHHAGKYGRSSFCEVGPRWRFVLESGPDHRCPQLVDALRKTLRRHKRLGDPLTSSTTPRAAHPPPRTIKCAQSAGAEDAVDAPV